LAAGQPGVLRSCLENVTPPIVHLETAATFYIPRPTLKRLREIALDRSTSLQQLLVEAVDQWLKKQGEGPFYPAGDRRAGRAT
jgi:hypothetical protein